MQCVYLLHFESPYYHAQHYVGWTTNLPRRIEQHRAGTGAALTCAVAAAGIKIVIARTWPYMGRDFEARLHHYRHNRIICPICNTWSSERYPTQARGPRARKEEANVIECPF